MNASRERRGLSLSKNLRTSSDRALTNSSFSQSISFIDKVLPQNGTKQIYSNSIRNSKIFQSFHSESKQRRSVQSHSQLQKTKTEKRLPQKIKSPQSYHQYLQESNRSMINITNIAHQNQHINLTHLFNKLSCELQQLNLEKQNLNSNIHQIKTQHEVKMNVLRQRRENLKRNINKQRESKIKPKPNNLPIQSNSSQIQELNSIIRGLIQDIQSTFSN